MDDEAIDKIVIDIAPVVFRFPIGGAEVCGLTEKGREALARDGLSFLTPAEVASLRAIATAVLVSAGAVEARAVTTLVQMPEKIIRGDHL